MAGSFVPDDFDVPTHLAGPGFHLDPLGPEHNERDHEAWMSSIDHIRATPGFDPSGWPQPMSLEANLSDLEDHARDFENRTGFTYSILDGDDIVGCVYIYPSASANHDADVHSWVRESRADLDPVIWSAVSDWMATSWPFERPIYATRT